MPDLLLELFSEEIPARMQARAADDLRRLVTDRLVSAGLVCALLLSFQTATLAGLNPEALWDAGLTYREIATEVGWNRNIVAEAMARWHRERGLQPPDGRSWPAGRLRR